MTEVIDSPIDRQRVRITYAKGEPVKFISHQDEFRLWERTLRRADLPLLYKQGFNPQPHMQFASPLGVGITGNREFLDITFAPPLPVDELTTRIQAKLPPGVTVHTIEEVPVKTPSLQSLLLGSDYTILIYAEPEEIPDGLIQARIDEFLAQETVWRERQRKGTRYRYNLRPLVFELTYSGYDPATEEHRIFLRVQQRDGATGRPDEVVDALGFDDFARTLRRERIHMADDPDAVALMARYPVIEQAQIDHPDNVRPAKRRGKNRRQRRGKPDKAHSGERPEIKPQSFAEKAADEFV